MDPKLTGDEIDVFVDDEDYDSFDVDISGLVEAQLRKAVTWAGETISDEHFECALDCGCGGWLSRRLEELAKELGIEPWEDSTESSQG